jgi:hypothetical protein
LGLRGRKKNGCIHTHTHTHTHTHKDYGGNDIRLTESYKEKARKKI